MLQNEKFKNDINKIYPTMAELVENLIKSKKIIVETITTKTPKDVGFESKINLKNNLQNNTCTEV
jgi:hypothetical protein